MDRSIVYPGQVPLSEQILTGEKNKMIGLAFMAQAVLGTATVVDGLVATPMTPATLSFQVGPGQIYELENVDTTAYGTVALDVAHSIVKQGINQDTSTFTLTPPGTAGYAINYLVQASLVEADTGSTTLPYFNSANPTIPFTGPNNSGTAQPTLRSCSVALSIKGGVAATSGTQATPAPDVGYVGLYVVTVPYGATTITSSNITVYSTAPFLSLKLPNVPTWVQAGNYAWGVDTGTANAMVTALTPAPMALTQGLRAFIKKGASANTGAVTLNVNGLGAVAVLDSTGAALASGALTGNFLLHAVYDGTSWRAVNGSYTSTTVSSITAMSGEGITVDGTNKVNLNYPGLTADTPTALDLMSFYDNEGSHHKSISWANLLTAISGGLQTGLLNVSVVTSSGTWTKTAGAKKALVFATAGGGGGAGRSGFRSGGGGAGATAIAFVDLTAISTVSVSVGGGGAGGTNSFGSDGSATSFGSYAVAGGGKGGGYGSTSPAATTEGPGGPGGIATVGLMLCGGSPGSSGERYDGGAGGNSFWGGGGRGGDDTLYGAPGGVGTAMGAGGGGSDYAINTSGSPGGAGADGGILILEFA
ncbi:glycine-rich domain-containing protein [Xanthobacter versatilis]|uniref:glycine-rich domain-containing protein n=1 Tax=Xanthobacter autotrophicus (strain ATCC BAA-1158 / Py2) TaxID=78245 RepID=UPI00372C4CCA